MSLFSRNIKSRVQFILLITFCCAGVAGQSISIDPPQSSPTAAATPGDKDGGLIQKKEPIEIDGDSSNITLSIKTSGSNPVIQGQDRVVEADEIYPDDLVVFGGSADIFGEVQGDLVIFGGDVNISGKVDGDAVVFGGKVWLTGASRIEGSLVTFAGSVDREDGAFIGGDEVNLAGIPLVSSLGHLLSRTGFDGPEELNIKPMRYFHGVAILWWFVVSLVAVLLLSRNTEQASRLMRADALKSILVGFIFHSAILMLMMFFVVTVIGIPLSLVVLIFWVAVGLFAVPVGFLTLGSTILDRFNRNTGSIMMPLLLGFIILSLSRFLPFMIGLFLWHLWMMAAIGATVLSKFGTMQPWFKKTGTAYPGPQAGPPAPYPHLPSPGAPPRQSNPETGQDPGNAHVSNSPGPVDR